jgi:hypothetical protein
MTKRTNLEGLTLIKSRLSPWFARNSGCRNCQTCERGPDECGQRAGRKRLQRNPILSAHEE